MSTSDQQARRYFVQEPDHLLVLGEASLVSPLGNPVYSAGSNKYGSIAVYFGELQPFREISEREARSWVAEASLPEKKGAVRGEYEEFVLSVAVFRYACAELAMRSQQGQSEEPIITEVDTDFLPRYIQCCWSVTQAKTPIFDVCLSYEHGTPALVLLEQQGEEDND